MWRETGKCRDAIASVDVAGLLLLAMLPAIAIETPQLFGDWVAACDNTRRCLATSLPEAENQAQISGHNSLLDVTLTRSGAANADTILSLVAAPPFGAKNTYSDWRISVDDVLVNARPKWQNGVLTLSKNDSRRLLAAISKGETLRLLRSGSPVASLQVAPVRKILAYFEERHPPPDQAIIPAGKHKGVLNELVIPGPSFLPAATLTDAQLEFWSSADKCLDLSATNQARVPRAEFHRLDASTTLIMINSVCPGYNPQSLMLVKYLIGSIRPALFGHHPFSDAGEQVLHLPGARWSSVRRRLIGWAKGRAIGDCGQYAEFAWDGVRFQLTEYRAMPVCRGSFNLIPLYTRPVREIPQGPPPVIVTQN